MYMSQYFIDTVEENSKELKKLIATDLFTIREPFEHVNGAKPRDWNHVKIETIIRVKGDVLVNFTYHGEDYSWTLKHGIL